MKNKAAAIGKKFNFVKALSDLREQSDASFLDSRFLQGSAVSGGWLEHLTLIVVINVRQIRALKEKRQKQSEITYV